MSFRVMPLAVALAAPAPAGLGAMDAGTILMTGIVATAAADLWQQLLKRGAGLAVADWALIGRWVAGMPRGVFVRSSIAKAAPVEHELAVGWVFHYLVGVVYAGLYLAIVKAASADPGFVSALAFGVLTLAAPWFVMQPALGFGIMARHLPNRRAVLLATTTTHLMFGLGLYAGARVSAAAGGIAPMLH